MLSFFKTKRLKPLVLHVDDSDDILVVTEVMLKEIGLDVLSSQRAEEGIALAQKSRPDVILMDVQMPGTNGYVACRRLKVDDKTKNIPVIMATGEDTLKDIEKALMYYGADDYIVKPITREKLKAKLAKFLPA